MVPTAPRVAGDDRYLTSIAAAAAVFPGGAGTVLVSAGNAAVDGTIAAGMAAAFDAPLLYVGTTGVPAGVMNELRRLAPSAIVVVGGTTVVADSVLTQLRTVTPDVRRFGGATRYDTSRAALANLGAAVDTVYLAGGSSLIDAPLASVAAARTGRGALLVDGLQPAADAATIDALRAAGARSLVLVGGNGTIGTAYQSSLAAAGFQVTRRVAADRFSQTVLMAGEQLTRPARSIVVHWATPPDVGVAAALAAVTRQPLYYAIEQCMPDVVSAHLAGSGVGITGVGGTYWLENPVIANSPCAREKARRESALNTAIRSTMGAYPGSFTVTVTQLGSIGETTSIGGADRHEPASMMKIFASWAILSRIQRGVESFGTRLPSGVTLGECIHVMIHASDNFCHTDVVHWIGISELNRMIREAGFTGTVYGSVPPGTSVLYAGNRSTTNDLTFMMRRLSEGSILSRPYADHLLNLMRSQIWRSRIASGIPPGIGQASKPGALWIASGLLQADTAIVNGSRYSYAISIIGDNGPPQDALRAISRTVYQHFHGGFGAAASYPVQQMVTSRETAFRSSPGGPMVVAVPPGVPIQVHDANRIWYLVQYGSRQLWAHFADLRNR